MNGGTFRKIPSLAFYFASNEISNDSEDMAFFDRLSIRCFTSNVSPETWEELLSLGVKLETSTTSSSRIILSKEEAMSLQRQVISKLNDIAQNSQLIKKYIEVLSELRNKGIEISDRRKIKILKIASAISVIYLESIPSLDSLADALRFSCSSLEELKTVEELILKLGLSSFYLNVQQLNTLQTELQNNLNQLKSNANPTLQDLQRLSTVYKKSLQVLKGMPKSPRLLPYVRSFVSTLDEAKNVIRKVQESLTGESNV
jgi:MoxR-like ATPase